MKQDIPVDNWGQKLMISTLGRNKLPMGILSNSKNARIVDNTITKRKGSKTVLTSSLDGENQGITYNNNLFVVADSHLRQADLSAGTLTDIGDIGYDGICNFVNYGKYTLIFTGTGFPYYYDGTTLTQTTSTVCPDVSPYIADTFTGFTFMVGNTTDTNNVLYISRPIDKDNQDYCYDWVGADSSNITFKSPVLGLKSTMQQLFIFTEQTIEYIDKSSLATTSGSAYLISTPIGKTGPVASSRAIVAAGNKIFYLTKENTINTVNYASGTVDSTIGTLTDKIEFKITQYLKTLDSDQSNSFGFYDEKNKLVYFFMRTIGSAYNDTILFYDLENQTRGTDTKKFYNDMTTVNSIIYAGSSLNNNIIQDDIGLDDDNSAIEFEIEDSYMNLGTIREKLFTGWHTSGGLNPQTNMEITTYVDGNAVNICELTGDYYFTDRVVSPLTWRDLSAEGSYTTTWEDMGYSWEDSLTFVKTVSLIGDGLGSIGGSEIGGTAIGGLSSDYEEDFKYFDRAVDHGNLYTRGKRIKRIIKENTVGSNFYLDTYTILAGVTGDIQLNDKF